MASGGQLPDWAKRPELCGRRKHTTSYYAADPASVSPVSADTSYRAHYPQRELPAEPRFPMDSSGVLERHAGSPLSCTVRADAVPPLKTATIKDESTFRSTGVYNSTVHRDFAASTTLRK